MITREMAILREACKSTVKLLENPHLGLLSDELLRNSLIDLQSALCSLGATPKFCGIELPDHLK